ncbi:hypothetical protein D3C85_1460090 [compost metagenome]
MVNRMRDTAACEASAEPRLPATYAAVKKLARNCPPALNITSLAAASALAKVVPGSTSWLT